MYGQTSQAEAALGCAGVRFEPVYSGILHNTSICMLPVPAAGLLLAAAVLMVFSWFCPCPRAADDQASIQASGLRRGGREGHPGARLLQTHRLGTPREQGDTAAVQTQSGTWGSYSLI